MIESCKEGLPKAQGKLILLDRVNQTQSDEKVEILTSNIRSERDGKRTHRKQRHRQSIAMLLQTMTAVDAAVILTSVIYVSSPVQ